MEPPSKFQVNKVLFNDLGSTFTKNELGQQDIKYKSARKSLGACITNPYNKNGPVGIWIQYHRKLNFRHILFRYLQLVSLYISQNVSFRRYPFIPWLKSALNNVILNFFKEPHDTFSALLRKQQIFLLCSCFSLHQLYFKNFKRIS